MISLLNLNATPIYEQLRIEEALLRTETGNYCLINTNAPAAIVMGISGKPEKLLNLPMIRRDNVPLIKRYSGGGTVYTDEGTLFVSFICNAEDFAFSPYPGAILEWSERFYDPLFPSLNFHLRENDYVIGKRKIGGNAQYIKKGRWLLHTSFLWDFSEEKMEYLLLPEKRPSYRGDRAHSDFLSPLSSYFPCKMQWIENLKTQLSSVFQVQEIALTDTVEITARAFRQATNYVNISSD